MTHRPSDVLFTIVAATVVVLLSVGLLRTLSLPENDAVGPLGPGNIAEDRQLADAPPYERAAFGRWADLDGDCQDTRNEVLVRDLEQVVLSPDGCVVLSGVLVDPYVGNRVEFTRGRTTSSAVQIDHVLPLAEAWDAGAWRWTSEERRSFYNDPGNLVASSGDVNRAKGSRLPSEWVQFVEQRGADCAYVANVVLTVADWRLDLNGPQDSSEENWIDGWLDGDCPSPLTLVP